MDRVNLQGEWRLRGEFLDVGPERWSSVVSKAAGDFHVLKEDKPRHMPSRAGSLSAQMPGDVMQALIKSDIVQEPLEKTNSRDIMWVGEMSWFLWREFDVSEALLAHEQVRLRLGMLDYCADIILNGLHAGHHENAFRPFEQDVKEYLHLGKNQIVVRLTTGYEKHFPNDSLTFYCNSKFGQRVYLRKPQFTHGWDWCKPVPTCGIGGEMNITGLSGAHITSFRIDTLRVQNGVARLRFHFEAENLRIYSADDARLDVSLRLAGRYVLSHAQDFYAAGGLNIIEWEADLPDPVLWWPNGYGEQPLYEATASVTCRSYTDHMEPKRVGVRTIELNMDKYQDGTRRFDFYVNGVRVFCKGGNWVPADSLYLRIPESKYRALVDEAAACNFTMLRVWGGGLYEPDCFYEACSERGILIMQDFMYACAFYPEESWFIHEAHQEAEYQTKRLGSQACLAVWTGNNEIHESYTDWFEGELAPKHLYGAAIFNYLLPEITRKNTPLTHYMPSSPYYGAKANDMLAGDSHVWRWTRKPNETGFSFVYELEAFDRLAAKVRFSSEFGFYGALTPDSVGRFHAGEPVEYLGDIWRYHGEHERKRSFIDQALGRHMINPEQLDGDTYLLYGGMLQGVLYEEMTLALRRHAHCSGQLIWMYNDCWPETGWTVIDYYVTRKHSFYFLKRAFAPRRIIMREVDGELHICMLNEAPTEAKFNLELGYVSLAGGLRPSRTLKMSIDPHSRLELTEAMPQGNPSEGVYYALTDHSDYEPVTTLRGYYRDYPFQKANVEILHMEQLGESTMITLRADAFVPVTQLQAGDDTIIMSDNFFPLLPGIDKRVTVRGNVQSIKAEAVQFIRAPLETTYTPSH